MPFTPGHVAAILPFARTPLVPAALVVGSMAPDLFYYVPTDVSRELSHSLPGLVTVDLALGLVVFALWELVFRAPALDALPRPVRSRLGNTTRRRLYRRFAALIVVSVLLGSLSHLVWDSFTHVGWLSDAVPLLGEEVGPMLVVKWLQHISSAVGAIVLLAWAWQWYTTTAERGPAPTRFTLATRAIAWAMVVAVGLAVSLAIWVGGILDGIGALSPALIFDTVTVGIGAAGLAAFVVSVVWLARPRVVHPAQKH